MKKSVFMGLVAVLGLIGCTRNQEIDIRENGLTLVARTESPADTKTVVEEGVHVFWEPGDEIAVFMGEKSAKFTTDLTAPSGTATFKGTFGDESWPEELDLWAVYPYSEDATFDGETITTVLPSEQVAREGSFGKDMNLSIAHSTSSSVQFYNVGGGLRFSVTEEGIKKVMFEGLSGEIISGKVKIAFDENGTPVVKEVSGGSQFITLLPPSGKETFEPGTWYYIVAIPRSLEGGYKLRFYKDSDYARKVSEKAVEIKRSIYGNIEKADEGIEYEAQTMHFPGTEEEIIESNHIAESIAASISFILHNNDNENPEVLAQEILEIDGVLQANINEEASAIVIMQKDSSYINYLLAFDETDYTLDVDALRHNENCETGIPLYRNRSIQKSSVINQEGTATPSNKTAILISPYQNSYIENNTERGDFNVDHSFIKDALAVAGYTLAPPVLDSDATLDSFNINNLSKYGIVLIRTHGVANARTNHGEITTALMTREELHESVITEIFVPRFSSLARCIINDNQIFYAATVPWMDDCATSSTRFPNSLVYAGDCEGMKNADLRDCFFKYGAAVCCGYSDIVAHGTANFAMYRYINLLASGAGSHYSHANAVYSQDAIDYQSHMENKWKCTGGSQLRSLFRSYFNPELDISDFYLNDLSPKLSVADVNGNEVSLEWASNSIHNLEIETIQNFDYQMPYLRLELRYSVFINGKNVARDITNNKLVMNDLEAGDYSWYVVSKVINDGEICDTFRTDGDPFTVTDSPSSEETLVSRTYGGKTYSIIRKDVSTSDYRINGDGSKFYPCSYSVKVDNKEYELPGPFYSYQTDRPLTDMGPVLAVDSSTGEMNVFFIEKDVDEYYGMCGYVFTISGNSITQWTLFTGSNFGWFPYFERNDNQLLLNIFSYAGYFSIIGMQDEDWALYYNEDIYPDDFKAKQDQNELIMIY